MTEHKPLEQRCCFKTERLLIKGWKSRITDSLTERRFAEEVISILTKPVTKSLPDGWQGIDDINKAISWINNRDEESEFLTVQQLSSLDVVGFLFLYESTDSGSGIDLRLGYLLSESAWGKGFGTELIKGLVEWCEKQNDIKSISGGVETENVGSIKVLEKNGFKVVQSNSNQGDVVFLERCFQR